MEIKPTGPGGPLPPSSGNGQTVKQFTRRSAPRRSPAQTPASRSNALPPNSASQTFRLRPNWTRPFRAAPVNCCYRRSKAPAAKCRPMAAPN